MRRTGKGYGLEVNSLVDERRDPYKSTEAAVRYLERFICYMKIGIWLSQPYRTRYVNKAIARSGGKRDYWQIYSRLPVKLEGTCLLIAAITL